MSEEEQPKRKKGPAWKAAEDYGFDMSIIESNLRRTPLQRIRAHDAALQAIRQLRESVEHSDAR